MHIFTIVVSCQKSSAIQVCCHLLSSRPSIAMASHIEDKMALNRKYASMLNWNAFVPVLICYMFICAYEELNC